MFRELVATEAITRSELLALHPAIMNELLEVLWSERRNLERAVLGTPDRRSNLESLLEATADRTGRLGLRALAASAGLNGLSNRLSRGFLWKHLIYAYMIENTNVYEIFRRVVFEFVHGEKLGVPIAEMQPWLRTTEEIFYRDPEPFSITAITSHVRADIAATRRNAYQRMFGMTLNHGRDDGKPNTFVEAQASNKNFVEKFEEFLHEVWIGFTNRTTTSGPNPTDNSKILTLVNDLRDMLLARRVQGNLSREEFTFVAMMSWFHFTLDDVNNDTPILLVLSAQAPSPEERLFAVAQRVGLPAHKLSRSYFLIADQISDLLILIETGSLNAGNIATLYQTGPLQEDMQDIITHWSIIRGRDVKSGKVVTASATTT